MTSIEETGLRQIGKLRHDADLWLPWDGGYSGSGRPRKYKSKAEQKGELGEWNHVGIDRDGTKVYQENLFHKASGKLLNVVLLRRVDGSRVSQTLLFSTELEQDAMQPGLLLSSAVSDRVFVPRCQAAYRTWRLSVNEKGSYSYSCQCINDGVDMSMKLEDRREAATDEETVISIDSWKRRKINQNLMNRLFFLLDLDLTDEKVRATYKELSKYGSIAA